MAYGESGAVDLFGEADEVTCQRRPLNPRDVLLLLPVFGRVYCGKRNGWIRRENGTQMDR